jgi:hypothetical protein
MMYLLYANFAKPSRVWPNLVSLAHSSLSKLRIYGGPGINFTESFRHKLKVEQLTYGEYFRIDSESFSLGYSCICPGFVPFIYSIGRSIFTIP